MAGIPVPEDITGRSLLKPDALAEDRIFYGDSLHTNFCVMRSQVKLVYTTCGDHMLLFHLKDDPMEQTDLSEDPAWQDKKQELIALLLEHVKETAPQVLEERTSPDGSSSLWFKTTPPPRFHIREQAELFYIDTFSVLGTPAQDFLFPDYSDSASADMTLSIQKALVPA